MSAVSELKLRKSIYSQLRALKEITGVRIIYDVVNFKCIHIESAYAFTPDYYLKWCDKMMHFRVYILVGTTGVRKENAGYTICCIKSKLSANDFVTMYGLLYKNKSNDKS